MKILNLQEQLRVLAMSALTILATMSWGQTYEGGNTHYPNGTIYVGTSPHTGGPVVTGPDREDGSWERVDCEKNPKRCKELLEDASGDLGDDDGGGEASTEGLSAQLRAERQEYRQQLKIKQGVWIKNSGKWTSVDNAKSRTAQIIRSWNR